MATVYITAPPEAGARLAESLVEHRLAACVNALDARSVYRWEGAVHDDEEVLLLAKTTDERYDDLVAHVEEAHPYDVPCIERFDETDALERFAEWRDAAVERD